MIKNGARRTWKNVINEKATQAANFIWSIYLLIMMDTKAVACPLAKQQPNNNNNNNNNNKPLSWYFKIMTSRHYRIRHEHQLILFPYDNRDVIRDDNSVAGGLLRCAHILYGGAKRHAALHDVRRATAARRVPAGHTARDGPYQLL